MNIIKEHFTQIKPLIEDIKAEFKIVSNDETTSKRGEYSILFYIENKDNYLLNAGYMMEQVDLLLSEMNIGACWYGMAKAKETKQNDMEFVIMLSVGKCREDDFRKSINEFKRKDLSVILKGDMYTLTQ
ncbi:nitroreductase family protein [Anaerofustis stercorihominis]|uniref:nitroreductase family protein n=1 Tax=Anaerofustis stercorihominis TaxID=214853 RepID=UPI000A003C3F